MEDKKMIDHKCVALIRLVRDASNPYGASVPNSLAADVKTALSQWVALNNTRIFYFFKENETAVDAELRWDGGDHFARDHFNSLMISHGIKQESHIKGK